jgi:hypothetical protein
LEPSNQPNQRLRRLALESDAVERVIIASPDKYGQAIARIRPGSGYTENNIAVGVGKTIPRVSAGRVVSDIALQTCIFESLVPVWSEVPTPESWDPEQQLFIYVVGHEFGHARDHLLRSDAFEWDDPRPHDFSIQNAANYYASIVLTDFAACLNASSMMTQGLFKWELIEATKRIVSYKQDATKYLSARDTYNRRVVAHVVCQYAWVTMLELAKLYGHAKGNTAIRTAVQNPERSLVNENCVGNVLDGYGEAYPNWNSELQIQELISVWEKYVSLVGVKFVRHEGRPDDFVSTA